MNVKIKPMLLSGLTPTEILTARDRLAPGARSELRVNAPPMQAGVYDILILIKPEILSAAGAEHALRLILASLAEAGIVIVRACALSGEWAAASGCIQDCYLPLYAHSKGLAALSERIAARLAGCAHAHRSTIADVMTGTAFLALSPGWSAEALATLCEVAGVTKLGAGYYVSQWAGLKGTRQILANGFQPHHEAHLTAAGGTLAALHVRSDLPLTVLRERVIGGIAPASAAAGSIRHRLWRARDSLGFTPTVMYNCVHVSPGILEAAFHIGSFFLDPPEAALERAAARTGRALAGRLAEALLAPWRSDNVPLLIDAFDLTEGLEPDVLSAWLDTYR